LQYTVILVTRICAASAGTQDKLPEKRETTSSTLRAERGAARKAAAAAGERARQPAACSTVMGYTSAFHQRLAQTQASSSEQPAQASALRRSRAAAGLRRAAGRVFSRSRSMRRGGAEQRTQSGEGGGARTQAGVPSPAAGPDQLCLPRNLLGTRLRLFQASS